MLGEVSESNQIPLFYLCELTSHFGIASSSLRTLNADYTEFKQTRSKITPKGSSLLSESFAKCLMGYA